MQECNNCVSLWNLTSVISLDKNDNKRVFNESILTVKQGNVINKRSVWFEAECMRDIRNKHYVVLFLAGLDLQSLRPHVNVCPLRCLALRSHLLYVHVRSVNDG